MKVLYMHKPNQNNHNQRGAVSFLTVIFLAMLLTTITISFVRLSINEQRQATDDDLTNRAFYAAESGVEDAKRAIEMLQNGTLTTPQLNGIDCAPPLAGGFSSDLIDDPAVDSEYTCQLIDMEAPNFQAELDAWESVTVPLVGVNTSWNNIEIRWHIVGNGPGTDGSVTPRPSSGTPPTLPRVTSWNAQWAAMLRSNVFDIPASGNLNRSSYNSRSGFVNPGNAPVPTVALTSGLDKQIINAGCSAGAATNEYACTAVINGFSPGAREYYLRLQSIYRPTHIQVTLRNNAVAVDLAGVQAVVDVTGRAGDVYRRVEARVDLAGSSYPFPDFALMSANDICKNFAVTDDPDDFDDLNTAITTSCTTP
jgi:hypothetical protein